MLKSRAMTTAAQHLMLLLFALLPIICQAKLLDDAGADEFMHQLAEALEPHGIDVLPNLNHRQLARGRNIQPRLGRFPDLPDNMLPTSQEIQAWEQAFRAGEIGAAVILSGGGQTQPLWQNWRTTYSPDRIFITFAQAEINMAKAITRTAMDLGHPAMLFVTEEATTEVGRFYATAAKRLALDSRSARKLDSPVTELEYLGQRIRTDSQSIFRKASRDRRITRQEPAVFLKQSLGDEFSESTVREIIVPGGVALGEFAHLGAEAVAMRFVDGKLQLAGQENQAWYLPPMDPKTLKALFDFSERSRRIQSDAVVDIDGEGRVKISSALRDTDIGFHIMHADTLPFKYVRNLNVTKSVIIDTGVDWFTVGQSDLRYVTDYEVRFLSADNMRLAQTRVALGFSYDSEAGISTHQNNWGRDATRLRDNLDYSGLGRDLQDIAVAAAWVAMFRTMQDGNIPFLDGRYEFMKLDKIGRKTPARY